MKLLADQVITGELKHEKSEQIYSVDDKLISSATGFLMVEFA
jgi:hypothetical protein